MQEQHKINPRLAVISSNYLEAFGFKTILQKIMPMADVDIFIAFSEFDANDVDSFFHYFVDMSIVLSNKEFFIKNQQKTIILTQTSSVNALSGFKTLCVNLPERDFIKQILTLEQGAHKHGKNLPDIHKETECKLLSDREIEVLALLVKGNINKEIAAELNIGVTTVITHRKNIMEKLNAKNVSTLVIYAITNGYVDINDI